MFSGICDEQLDPKEIDPKDEGALRKGRQGATLGVGVGLSGCDIYIYIYILYIYMYLFHLVFLVYLYVLKFFWPKHKTKTTKLN